MQDDDVHTMLQIRQEVPGTLPNVRNTAALLECTSPLHTYTHRSKHCCTHKLMHAHTHTTAEACTALTCWDTYAHTQVQAHAHPAFLHRQSHAHAYLCQPLLCTFDLLGQWPFKLLLGLLSRGCTSGHLTQAGIYKTFSAASLPPLVIKVSCWASSAEAAPWDT